MDWANKQFFISNQKHIIMENAQTAQFNRYSKGLKEMERQADSGKNPIQVAKFYTHHQLPTATTRVLTEAGIADFQASGNRKSGMYVTFKKVTTTSTVNEFIRAYEKYNEDRRAEAAAKKGPKVTSTKRTSKKIQTLDAVPDLIIWLNDKVAKNKAAPGYLRPDEAAQLPLIVGQLEVLNKLRDTLPLMAELVKAFSTNTAQDGK